MSVSRTAAGPIRDDDQSGTPGSGATSGTDQGPLGRWSFLGFAVISFGGPLALAGLVVPGVIADAGPNAGASAGLAVVIATVVFAAPLAIWLRYSRHINSSGGLYGFVAAAAGRRVALVQAAIWAFSYLLYIVYTTEQIVYDLLPAVFPGVGSVQTLLALLIPITLAAVMVSGRTAAMVTAGLLALSQLLLVGVLDVVTLANVGFGASSLGTSAPTSELAKASFQTSLLYVCGSLPLFLGGELARPKITMRRGLTGVYLLTALVVFLAVAPLASSPLLRVEVPGVLLADRYVGAWLGDAIGVGLALSVGGVMLAEFFALTRLVRAVTSWRLRPITWAIAAFVVAAAPIMLIDPDGLYDALLKPSLIALWLSQLIVFAVYPRFARAHGGRLLPACALSLIASGLAVYGLVITLQHASS
jgi:hypothetical protein